MFYDALLLLQLPVTRWRATLLTFQKSAPSSAGQNWTLATAHKVFRNGSLSRWLSPFLLFCEVRSFTKSPLQFYCSPHISWADDKRRLPGSDRLPDKVTVESFWPDSCWNVKLAFSVRDLKRQPRRIQLFISFSVKSLKYNIRYENLGKLKSSSYLLCGC